MTVGTFQTRNPHQTISCIVTRKPQDLTKVRKSEAVPRLVCWDTIMFAILFAHRHRALAQANDEQIGAVHQFDLKRWSINKPTIPQSCIVGIPKLMNSDNVGLHRGQGGTISR